MATTTHLEKELHTALELAQQAARAILPFYYSTVSKEWKADGTPVTEADRLANEMIVSGLRRVFPDDGIISEEMQDVQGNRYWYIDPIDGTRGFISHSDQFAIHIGLAAEEPLLGVVFKPTTGEYYVGLSGGDAYRINPDGSRREMQVARERSSRLKIIVGNEFQQEQPLLVEKLNSRNLVNGGQGLRMMYVADGRADIHLKYRPNTGGTWDICAPQAIVSAAGGVIMYADGSPVNYHGQRELQGQLVVASDRELAEYAAGMLRDYYREKVK